MKPIVVKESTTPPKKPRTKKAPKQLFQPNPCKIAAHILYCKVKSCIEAGSCTYRTINTPYEAERDSDQSPSAG